MNRLLVTTAALLSFATIGSAVAADLPAAPVYKAPVAVAQVYNWTGFYLGGNIGYSWVRSATTVQLGSFVTPIVTTSGAFLTSTYRSHITDNILRVGFDYKFDSSGPILAKY
jgi:outer membrane immunogenic protein